MILFIGIKSYAQSDYITLGSRQYDIIDRFEILLRKDGVLNFSTIKPYDRRVITQCLEHLKEKSVKGEISLSKTDKYNLDLLLMDNFEWRSNNSDTTRSIRAVFSKKSLTTPMYAGIKDGDFSFYISPIVNVQGGHDNNLNSSLFESQRGFYVRGTLTKNLGYYSYYTTNQERDPAYVQQYEKQYSAVPGEGYYKSYKTDGYDYFDARGGIMYKASKGINVQFAYDKVFIGDGFRSLILSDCSSDFLFLKINTHFWKFNYYNLFAQMVAPYQRGADHLLPASYMALHHLDFQATKWLNIGVFENVMFGRSNGYDLHYLNPVIFYTSAEQQQGSPDKTTIGATFKANAFKNTQFYGQLIINEFILDQVLHYGRGYWANKQALQLGAKFINVFTIKNLDAQFEANIIRPFVYSHNDSVSTSTNYNQPLGANLREFIAILKYQPIPKLQLKGTAIYYEQGLDSAGEDFGSNPFENYNNRPRDYGFKIGSGILAKCLLANLSASYEIIPNAFIDATAILRYYKKEGVPDFKTNIFTLGFRMNIQKREFYF